MAKGKCVIVMGVSGCGKSTVAKALASDMDAKFIEGDDLHPQANIDKMKSDIPLTDEDRKGWLQAIHSKIKELTDVGKNCTVSCSALKLKYREVLRKDIESIAFVYLKGSYNLIYGWVEKRKNHFMPPELLKSQFATLEEPTAEESDVITVNIDTDLDDEMKNVVKQLKEKGFIE